MSLITPVLLKTKGKTDPVSVRDYKNFGGFDAFSKLVENGREWALEEVEKSLLLGRGGAAYPTGRKWKQLYAIKEKPCYIVCNGDEGEPGTFKDRELIEYTPLAVIEGMLIAGYIFGANRGYIYIRGEYRKLQKVFQIAIDHATEAGYLGENIGGIEGFNYTITIVSGAGAYVCGENSALLNSIEAKPGRPRVKPPHLAEVGLYSHPTLVNNVESYACIPVILREGGTTFLEYGTQRGGGTKLISISGHAKNRGTYEIALGTSLRDIIYNEELGGGTSTGRPVKFYHLGGQSGAIGFPEQLDTPYCYGALKEAGLSVGSGAVVVMDESVSVVEYIQQVVSFFVHESCGKCTPCRLGSQRMLELLNDFVAGKAQPGDVEKLEALGNQIKLTSACGLGQSINTALNACLLHARAEFEACITKEEA